MKCPHYDTARAGSMERSSAAAESRVLHLKASPAKEPTPIKPPCSPTGALFTSLNDTTKAVHNKENSHGREHNRSLDEGLEDSGYLSLQNSQIDDHRGEEEDHQAPGRTAVRQEKTTTTTILPHTSPSKSQARRNSSLPASLVAASTPVHHPRRTLLSSTPSDHHRDPDLPILKFQRAVCEELAKSYRKNKRYDWSVVSKVAEGHLLDRVIGGQMGSEYVDMFSSLLSRNMRGILTDILALLGDMDLISCKKVSRTWRKIICEDSTALNRCQRAEEELRESMSSLRRRACGLTRDVGVSRMVLSCMQTRASAGTPASSSSTSSSTSPSCRVNRRPTSSQKGPTPTSKCTRFADFLQAASDLKQHQSLRSCKRCGSPATHSPEAQRATCTRLTCLFDFCTCCQETFHGSSACRTVQPRMHHPASRSTPILPGSARSKRNIRRL